MYARPTIDGRLLDFGVSGRLARNALVMYDRQTETLWSQILGRAIEGELRGRTLDPQPALMTTWGAWRALHPGTLALQTDGRGRDPYADYYQRDDAGVHGEENRDARLGTKALVTGAVVDGRPAAWEHEALAGGPLRVDRVGDVPILVVYDEETATTLLFRAEADGRELSFREAESPPEPGLSRRIVDRETGTTWQAWTGVAIDGPLAGERLEPIPATSVFWFGWSDYYPGTELFGGSAGG